MLVQNIASNLYQNFPYTSSPVSQWKGLMHSGMLWIQRTTMFAMFGYGGSIGWEGKRLWRMRSQRNMMERQILHRVLLQPHAARGWILGICFSKSLVQARLTTLSRLTESRDTSLDTLTHSCKGTQWTWQSVAGILCCFHHFYCKEKPQCELQFIILNVHFWYRSGKRENMIIARISARPFLLQPCTAKKIKETLKLAPVGQCSSKLHKELNLLSATWGSPTKWTVLTVQHLMLHATEDKIIELHGIKLDNTYGSVWQVQFLHCNFTANYLVNLSCLIHLTGLDGPPIHRAFESAQLESQHASHPCSWSPQSWYAH